MPKTSDSTTQAASTEDYLRLHITPFNESLLNSYIPPSVLSTAKHISFHTLQNFSEKSFGYVELPRMEAQKVKKKLNGSILKGQKVKIGEAKPEKGKRKASPAEDLAPSEQAEKSKKARANETQGVFPGVELEEGRKIKRGWTEPADQGSKKKRRRDKVEEKGKKEPKPSKYTRDSEMLFRTKLPSQSMDNDEKKKSKSGKRGNKGKDVVHEFENRKVLPKRGAVADDHEVSRDYVEGKGWVDSDGNVIEQEKKAKRSRLAAVHDASTSEKQEQSESKDITPVENENAPSADPDQLAPDLRKAEKRKKRDERNARRAAERAQKGGEGGPATTVSEEAQSTQRKDQQNWTASSSALESLYKRRGVSDITGPLSLPSSTKSSPTKPPPINTNLNFSFGFAGKDGGDGNEEEEGDDVPPLTPFSQEDRMIRGVRSAAPTPDTAAIGRKFSFSFMDAKQSDAEDEDDGDHNEDEAQTSGAGAGLGVDNVHPDRQDQVEKEESEFSKWFWEHRGETNRAWKRRRKESLKSQRKRDNRRIGRKVT